ncbi:MAG: hypothetical protein SGI74_05490 [Oligoflexia bacterium]|nr:hypothetical protein [Oligoflexia bacterium]
MRTRVHLAMGQSILLVILIALNASVFFYANHADAKTSGKPRDPQDFTTAWLKRTLRKVITWKENCLKKKNCENPKVLKDVEDVLKAFDQMKDKAIGLGEENRGLKNQLRISQQTNMLASRTVCNKRTLKRELLLDEGIAENGSILFPKNVVGGTGGTCWSNSRRKKDATIVLCEWPLAINILTKGEIDNMPVIRQREYLFDPNECLQAVRVTDENNKGKKITELNYKECEKEWSAKSFTDLDPDQEIRKVDIIGACFRYYLLPPRDSKTGRVNPETSTPQKAN